MVRFGSDPRRFRLSRTETRAAGMACLSRNARRDPANPAPPVTKMWWYSGIRLRCPVCNLVMMPVVVASCQMFFKPQIQNDEQVPATHFFDLELRDAHLPVRPTDGNHAVRISANHRF